MISRDNFEEILFAIFLIFCIFMMAFVPVGLVQASPLAIQDDNVDICRIRTSNLQFAVHPVYAEDRIATNPSTLATRLEGNTLIVEGYTELYRYTGILVNSWWYYVSWDQPFCTLSDGEAGGWMPSAPSISIPVAHFPPGGCYHVYLNDGNERWLITDRDHPDGIVLQPDDNGWLELIGSPGQDEDADHYEPVRINCTPQ